jgi:acetolactate synthase-1/2/3 large subunit
MMSQTQIPGNQLPEQQPRREIADLLVDYLAQLEVEFVFGVPGGAIEPLYNALARSMKRGGPRPVVARHETGAAFMADGYFRQTGKLGVCCGTTGPGTTNLITGVASANENHIPMLVITAQTALSYFGRGASQESSCTGINTVAMFEYCTRYSTLVSHVNQAEHKIITAIMTAFGTPCGPTHLSIPWDILRSPAPITAPRYSIAELLHQSSLVDESAVEKLCQQIEQSQKIAFLIGDGCLEAIETILEVAQHLDAAIVTTPHGKGLVDPYHPLFRGIIGFAGHSSAKATLLDPGVDIIVACGTNLGEWASNGWDQDSLLNSRLIHVDSIEAHLAHSPMARLHVRGRLRPIFHELLNYLKSKSLRTRKHITVESNPHIGTDDADTHCSREIHFHLDELLKYNSDAVPIKPQRLMRDLSRLFPQNTCFLAETGNSQAWAIHYLHPADLQNQNNRLFGHGRFRACSEFVSMGWAIGAAVGTALGAPGNPVVCITGDGSLLMSGQEITVAIQEQLPVIFVVLNDSALGMVKHGQRLAGSAPIAFELPFIDYSAYAEAMGAVGHVVRSPQDLESLDIESMCRRNGPTVLDVRIDPEEVPPIGMRMKVLGGERQ